MKGKLQMYLFFLLGLFGSVAGATEPTSIVDYSSIMAAVSSELALGITAAAAVVGLIWGAKIGIKFVRSLLH